MTKLNNWLKIPNQNNPNSYKGPPIVALPANLNFQDFPEFQMWQILHNLPPIAQHHWAFNMHNTDWRVLYVASMQAYDINLQFPQNQPLQIRPHHPLSQQDIETGLNDARIVQQTQQNIQQVARIIMQQAQQQQQQLQSQQQEQPPTQQPTPSPTANDDDNDIIPTIEPTVAPSIEAPADDNDVAIRGLSGDIHSD